MPRLGRAALKSIWNRVSCRRQWLQGGSAAAVCAIGLGLTFGAPVASADVTVAAGATVQSGLNAVTTPTATWRGM